MIFLNQQINFEYDTLSSLRAMIHAGIKSCRSALFAFRMILLSFILDNLRGHLPMSLIPIDSQFAVSESVATQKGEMKIASFSLFH